MKNGNGKLINRTVPFFPHIVSHIFLFILVFLLAFPNFVYAADALSAAPAKVDNPSSSWEEIQLVLDTHGASWCGNRSIVFSGYGKDKGKGIRLYDLDTGVLQDITDNPSHRNVSCAANGRYIVFTDDMSMQQQGSLFVYDRNTKFIKKMYEMESLLLKIIDKMPLSPNANYLLGPDLPMAQQCLLPGGKEVKLVPYLRGMSHVPEYTKFQWSADESTLYLFDPNGGRLNIRDLKNSKDRNYYLERYLRKIRITKDNILYADQMFGSDTGDYSKTNLYIYEFPHQNKPRKLLVSNIEAYDADDEGNIVFSKALKNGRYFYYLVKGEKKVQILKEIAVPCNIGIWPRIANDGKGIIYSIPAKPKGTRLYTILIKKQEQMKQMGTPLKL